jgi:uncharacterized protein
MDTNTLLWIAAGALMLVGLVGTVLPALPGTVLVLSGIVLAAWIDDFARINGWTVALVSLFAAIAWITDYAAAFLGAKKVGASKFALLGAAIGTIVGVFTGLVGLLVFPFVGAVAGQYVHERDAGNAAKVGLGTWLGMLVGTVIKLVVVLTMLGIAAAAYWVN